MTAINICIFFWKNYLIVFTTMTYWLHNFFLCPLVFRQFMLVQFFIITLTCIKPLPKPGKEFLNRRGQSWAAFSSPGSLETLLDLQHHKTLQKPTNTWSLGALSSSVKSYHTCFYLFDSQHKHFKGENGHSELAPCLLSSCLFAPRSRSFSPILDQVKVTRRWALLSVWNSLPPLPCFPSPTVHSTAKSPHISQVPAEGRDSQTIIRPTHVPVCG